MNKEKQQLYRIGENDKVVAFDCDDEDLNDFTLTYAAFHNRKRLFTSYVWEDSITGEVFGYFINAHGRISLICFPCDYAYNLFHKQFLAQGKMFKQLSRLEVLLAGYEKSCRGEGVDTMIPRQSLLPTRKIERTVVVSLLFL